MKICLVANEILGAHRNGGIGTATSHLSVLFANHGHDVTLCYVGHNPLDTYDPWAMIYYVTGVKLDHYRGSSSHISPTWMKHSIDVFEHLRGSAFDIILFQDWMALGHACAVAKRTGLAFERTTLATISHSSTPWIMEANQVFPSTAESVALCHMERQAIELSDALISPSAYLRDWMTEAGWDLPEKTRVIPYFLGGSQHLGTASPSRDPARRDPDGPIRFAFWGRLEQRKGINLFLSALAADELKPFNFAISFIGRPETRSVDEIRAFIREIRPDLLANLDFQTGLSSDESQAYIAEKQCVALIPSLIDNSPCVVYEALKLGIPFIAAASGGIPELVSAEDRERCLFAPNPIALASKLREVLVTERWRAARPMYDEREVARQWLAWVDEHRPDAPSLPAPMISSGQTDVTVIVTHHERPRLLEQNLRALSVQSDAAFNVVVVDDGSRRQGSLEFLARIEKGFAGLPLTLVRQENKYLGAARNEGLRHADTPYVIFLDDDNVPFPNMVEVFRQAASHSGADILTCQMQFFHDPLHDPDPRELRTGERWCFPGGPAALGAVQNCFGDATAIYKRNIFERVGRFHEVFGVTHEDWQLHLRACLANYKLLSLPLPLFWYRVTPGSMARSTSAYANMRIIASTLRQELPPDIAPMVDFLTGMHLSR
jgi:glycosyltransferase involved in cell wall biosynthesis/GT2 family glycosyltransferase